MKNMIFLFALLLFSNALLAQEPERLTQTIRGTVTDQTAGTPLASITVGIAGLGLETVTDERGQFVLTRIPLGRHAVHAGGLHYETVIIKDVLLGSVREAYLEIELAQKTHVLEAVVISPKVNKDGSLNEMALIGSQMFSVEEASRFAGGMDDPARLASNYAGVATPSVNRQQKVDTKG